MFKIILLLNPVYVTLFWAVILSIHSKKIHLPKRFLSWFMIVAFVLYISHFFYFVQEFQVYFYLDSLYTFAYLLVFPMYHIYVRLLTIDIELSIKKHIKFLIAPFVLFLLTLTGYIIMGKRDGLEYLIYLSSGNNAPTGIHRYMQYVLIAGRIVFLLQVIIYLYLNFRLIRSNNIKLQDYYSSMEHRKLQWVQFLNCSLALTSLASVSLAIIGRRVFQQHENYLVFPSIVFTAMLFIIGFLGNSQKAVFIESESGKNAHEEDTPPVGIKTKLVRLFEEEKIFINQDLKIWDVSSMLGTNRTYVSKVINSEFGKNFCTYVNHHRVEHAKSVMQNNKNLTNEQIAELSGFGSLNSLYRAFLDKELISLGEYRKQIGIRSR